MKKIILLSLTVIACGSDGDNPPDGAEPLGPEDQWTWVDVPESLCINGSKTGFGVFPSSKSKRLLLFLQDGGACVEGGTCSMIKNPGGYEGGKFADRFVGNSPTESPTANSNMFDDGLANNPFKDWSKVYVPYCTGDIHAGNNAAGDDGYVFLGYKNMQQYLSRIAPAFADSEMVIIAGSSAGGFGALINYEQTQSAFGEVPVHMLNDSAPPLSDTYNTPSYQTRVRDRWDVNPSLPAECTECSNANGGGLGNLAPYLADKYSNRRFAFIQSYEDSTMAFFFGLGYPSYPDGNPLSSNQMKDAVTELHDTVYAGKANIAQFTVDSNEHVFLYSKITTQSGGVALNTWLQQFIDGAATWKTVTP